MNTVIASIKYHPFVTFVESVRRADIGVERCATPRSTPLHAFHRPSGADRAVALESNTKQSEGHQPVNNYLQEL
jgi:hypothetical protein